MIAYDRSGSPLDYVEDTYFAIPGGLGKRVIGRLADSVPGLAKKIEIRILGFEIVSV